MLYSYVSLSLFLSLWMHWTICDLSKCLFTVNEKESKARENDEVELKIGFTCD